MGRPPSTFHGFIGQARVVKRLRRQLEGAMVRQEPFPHSLFMGPTGSGETPLATFAAKESGTILRAAMLQGEGHARPASTFLLRENSQTVAGVTSVTCVMGQPDLIWRKEVQ